MASKAKMFNKNASAPKSKPDQILEALDLKQGQKVADIGAGGGYFAQRFAQAVGLRGRVYAVDTDLEKLAFIEQNVKEKGLTNLEAVSVKGGLVLPEKVDLVFFRNVCHHIPNRVEYFSKLREMMQPNGKVAIVEYKGSGGFSFHKLFGHFVDPKVIVDEMTKAGFHLTESWDFLPEQSFNIFSIEKQA
jgi:cyclopropane fatty-acyl-phospholipid synthase-like methyltransferase